MKLKERITGIINDKLWSGQLEKKIYNKLDNFDFEKKQKNRFLDFDANTMFN